MAFLADLGAFTYLATRPYLDPSASPRGLDLAVETIDEVIALIEEEQRNIKPDRFEVQGHISPASFGGGDRAPALALHHGRAHAVTADTLRGVLTDLRAFQQACRDAKNAIIDVDEDTAGRLRATQVAVDALAVTTSIDHGRRAHERAQHDHANDRPTDEPSSEDD
jgi:hypothetical protein